jgi:AsmA protein
VGGEGEINIGEGTLNYLVKASIVGTAKGQGGRELEDLRGVTVPVRIAGPLAAPSYQLDFRAMATDSAKEKVKDALRKRLGGAAKDEASKEGTQSGDKLKDALKGLFGR